jgi:copper homeostasis protein (lipoprotein)
MPVVRHLIFTCCFAAIGLSGCRSFPEEKPAAVESAEAAQAAAAEFPASFAGRLPCASCEGIETRLNLFADGVYYLHEIHLGEAGGEPGVHDVGRWSQSGEDRIRLDGGREAPLFFAEEADGSLRLLDRDGQTIASELDYRLAREARFQVLEPRIPLRGMLTVLGGAARFHDCLSGRDLRVADEGQYTALRQAYAAAGVGEGQSLLASLDGRIAQRPLTDSPELQSALVVERFRRVWPGENCGPRYADAELSGTTWKLSQLDGRLALSEAEATPATMQLDITTQRVTGSTGCNRFSGGFVLEGDRIRFSPAALTRMACPAAAMLQESAFAAMLGKAARLKVSGQQLEIQDEAGGVIARFDAMPLPAE